MIWNLFRCAISVYRRIPLLLHYWPGRTATSCKCSYWITSLFQNFVSNHYLLLSKFCVQPNCVFLRSEMILLNEIFSMNTGDSHVALWDGVFWHVITSWLSVLLFILVLFRSILWLYPSLLKWVVVVNHATLTFETVCVAWFDNKIC